MVEIDKSRDTFEEMLKGVGEHSENMSDLAQSLLDRQAAGEILTKEDFLPLTKETLKLKQTTIQLIRGTFAKAKASETADKTDDSKKNNLERAIGMLDLAGGLGILSQEERQQLADEYFHPPTQP